MTSMTRLDRLLGSTTEIQSLTAWRRAVVALLFATVLFPLTHTVADPDLWGHVRYGQDLLHSGQLPVTDPYSYTAPQQHWINHELLAELSFAWIYDHAGTVGLILDKTLVIAVILALVFLNARAAGCEMLPRGILVLLTAATMLPHAVVVRPHLFTYLFYALTVLALRQATRRNKWMIWLLPPLMTLWINTHGGVLAGIAMLGVWSLAQLVDTAIRHRRAADVFARRFWPIYALGATCLLALLVTPYGGKLLWFLLRTASVPRPEITEWNAVRLLSFEGLVYAVCLVGAIAVVLRGQERRVPVLAMLAFAAPLPLIAARHLPLFGLTMAILGADSSARAWHSLTRHRPAPPDRSTRDVRIVGAMAGMLIVCSLVHLRGIKMDATRFPMPVGAVAALHHARVDGNLAILFDWGQYAIWHLGPRVRVSMDGRRETVYGPEAYEEYFHFVHGTRRWNALLADYPTDMVLIPTGGAAANLLSTDPQWQRVYEDKLAVLFARRGSAQAKALAQVTLTDLVSPDDHPFFPGPADHTAGKKGREENSHGDTVRKVRGRGSS